MVAFAQSVKLGFTGATVFTAEKFASAAAGKKISATSPLRKSLASVSFSVSVFCGVKPFNHVLVVFPVACDEAPASPDKDRVKQGVKAESICGHKQD